MTAPARATPWLSAFHHRSPVHQHRDPRIAGPASPATESRSALLTGYPAGPRRAAPAGRQPPTRSVLPTPPLITILVVDDHPIVRQGLVAVLEDEPDFRVVGSAGSAEEGLLLAERQRPGVLLLDLELPGLDGVQALPRLLERSPDTRVIVFTAYDTDERVLGAVRAGARGYLLKGAAADEIARAVRVVHAGGSALEPRVAAKLLTRVREPRPAGFAVDLSEREREVLRLVAAGLPNKAIARALSIAERTVKFHVTSILRKLGADNRAQAVALGLERGLL